jgi:hypothetical protein
MSAVSNPQLDVSLAASAVSIYVEVSTIVVFIIVVSMKAASVPLMSGSLSRQRPPPHLNSVVIFSVIPVASATTPYSVLLLSIPLSSKAFGRAHFPNNN